MIELFVVSYFAIAALVFYVTYVVANDGKLFRTLVDPESLPAERKAAWAAAIGFFLTAPVVALAIFVLHLIERMFGSSESE